VREAAQQLRLAPPTHGQPSMQGLSWTCGTGRHRVTE
jgi:hypothetical protein